MNDTADRFGDAEESLRRLDQVARNRERGVHALTTHMEALASHTHATGSWEALARAWACLLCLRTEITEGEALTLWVERTRSAHQAPSPAGRPALEYEADIVRAGWPVLAWASDSATGTDDADTRWAELWTSALERERSRDAPPRELQALTRLMVTLFGTGQTPNTVSTTWAAALEAATARSARSITGDDNETEPDRTVMPLAVCALAAAGEPGTTLAGRITQAWHGSAPDPHTMRAAQGAVRRWAGADPTLDTLLKTEAGLTWTGEPENGQAHPRAPEPGAGTGTIVLLAETSELAELLLRSSAAHDAVTAATAAADSGATKPGLVRTRRRGGIAFELIDARANPQGAPALPSSPDTCPAHIAARLSRPGPRVLAIALDAAAGPAPNDELKRGAHTLLNTAAASDMPITLIASGVEELARRQVGEDASETAVARRMATLETDTTILDALTSVVADNELTDAITGLRALAGRDTAREAWIAALKPHRALVETIARHGTRAVDGILMRTPQGSDDNGEAVATLWASWWERRAPQEAARSAWIAEQLGTSLEADLRMAHDELPGDLAEALPRLPMEAHWARTTNELEAAHDAIRRAAWRRWRGALGKPEHIVQALKGEAGELRRAAAEARSVIEATAQCEETLRGTVRRHLDGTLRALGIAPHKRIATLLAHRPDAHQPLEQEPEQASCDESQDPDTRANEEPVPAHAAQALEQRARETARDALLDLAGSEQSEAVIAAALRQLADTEPYFDALTLPAHAPDPLKEATLQDIERDGRVTAIIDAATALLAVWTLLERHGGLTRHARASVWFKARMIACRESKFSAKPWEDAMREEPTAPDDKTAEAPWATIAALLHKCEEYILQAQQRRRPLARLTALVRRQPPDEAATGLKPWEASLKKAAASVAVYGAEIVQRRNGLMNETMLREDLAGLRLAIDLTDTLEQDARAGRGLPLPRPGWSARLNELDAALRNADAAASRARQRLERDLLRERAERARYLLTDEQGRETAAQIAESLSGPQQRVPWPEQRNATVAAMTGLQPR